MYGLVREIYKAYYEKTMMSSLINGEYRKRIPVPYTGE